MASTSASTSSHHLHMAGTMKCHSKSSTVCSQKMAKMTIAKRVAGCRLRGKKKWYIQKTTGIANFQRFS